MRRHTRDQRPRSIGVEPPAGTVAGFPARITDRQPHREPIEELRADTSAADELRVVKRLAYLYASPAATLEGDDEIVVQFLALTCFNRVDVRIGNPRRNDGTVARRRRRPGTGRDRSGRPARR